MSVCFSVRVCVCVCVYQSVVSGPRQLIGLTGSPVSPFCFFVLLATQSRVVIALFTPHNRYTRYTYVYIFPTYIYVVYVCIVYICICVVGWPPKAGNCPLWGASVCAYLYHAYHCATMPLIDPTVSTTWARPYPAHWHRFDHTPFASG